MSGAGTVSSASGSLHRMYGFGEAGKVADACRKFGFMTDAVLRAAREVVRDVHC